MKLRVKVESETFTLSVGKGWNDWVWLSHYAVRCYSKAIYPQGMYLPVLLYLETPVAHLQPHPHERIFTFMDLNALQPNQFTVVVRVRKPNHILQPEERKWENQAFREEKYFTQNYYSLKVVGVKKKIDFYFKIRVWCVMSEAIKHVVREQPDSFEAKLVEKSINATDSLFEATLRVPYGSSTQKLLYYYRESANEPYTEVDLSDTKMKSEDFKMEIQPKVFTVEQINALVAEEMKISQSINKSLQEKQLETKKRHASSSLCCFSFDQLWGILESTHGGELSLKEYQQLTIHKIKICLEKCFSGLYELFFYYLVLEDQQRDKKEDLGITYQHVMHFLSEYHLFPSSADLLGFIQFYNSDAKFSTLEDTLDSKDHPVRFPQFIAILLRSVQFVQTSTFMMKGETFDCAVGKVVEQILQVSAEEDEYTEFRRNMRQNPKIISFIRNNNAELKRLFSQLVRNSVQAHEGFFLKKEEIKAMMHHSGLTEKNTDSIIDKCFRELHLRDEGIFFYDFVEVVQWLAIATIASDKEVIDNPDEEALLIAEKMRFLLQKTLG